MTRTYKEVVEAREQELEQFRGAYQEAKALAGGRDGKEIITLTRLLKSYLMGESPEKAVYIVAQATMLANKLAEPFVLIENYEAKRKDLEKLKLQLPAEVTG
jgi:hypothetical protein